MISIKNRLTIPADYAIVTEHPREEAPFGLEIQAHAGIWWTRTAPQVVQAIRTVNTIEILPREVVGVPVATVPHPSHGGGGGIEMPDGSTITPATAWAEKCDTHIIVAYTPESYNVFRSPMFSSRVEAFGASRLSGNGPEFVASGETMPNLGPMDTIGVWLWLCYVVDVGGTVTVAVREGEKTCNIMEANA